MAVIYEPFIPQAQHLAMLLGEAAQAAHTYDDLVTAVAADRDQTLVLFGSSVSLSEAVTFAAQQRLIRPALGVVLLREHLDLDVLGEALRAGVREVANVNDPSSVLAACSRSMELSRQLQGGAGGAERPPAPTAHAHEPEAERDARVITVFSAKGGCGKTTLATNLSVALAAGGNRKVCLIDLDLAFGDVAIMLQLNPEKTIADLIPVADRIDQTGLRATLTQYSPGVDTLLAPVQPAVSEEVTRELVFDLIQLARTMFDYVVIDTPPHFNENVLAALDASHLYVLVATPELPALKNLRITLDMFDMLDYRRENRLVVLNRADAKVGLTSSDIDRVVRTPIAVHVPSSRDVPVSVNRGIPIVLDNPGHAVSSAIRGLANSHISVDAEGRARGLRGLISRRARR